LPAHVIACVVDQLPADDELAVALTCRELRTTSEHSSRWASGAQLTTRPSSLFSSLRKLEWGVACGAGLSPDLCNRATRGGNLDQLVWLRSIGCKWDEDTCKIASAHGHLHILQWARQNGCPWNEETCELAAANGHYDSLVWARENGCPWSAMTFEQAVAATDRPEMLTFLWVLGCPWDRGVCERAAYNGFVRSLRWAHEYRFPLGGAVPYAAQEGRLEALKLFLELGIPWDEWYGALVRAARGGQRATLEWLLANGCPVRDDELSGIEAEVVSEIMAVAASVKAQAAAAPAAAPEGAGAAPANASGVA
jgi:hypothetical protein